jgi:hypothetical protein
MPVRGSEKTKAKQSIMRLLLPRLQYQGFACAGGGRTGGTFHLTDPDGSRLVLVAQVPTFDSFFRLWCYWETANGERVAYGPQSLPYECPNLPGDTRYTFRFHRDSAGHESCAANIADWVRRELLPWFRTRSQCDWKNPKQINS